MRQPITNTERIRIIRSLRKKARENKANVYRRVAELLALQKRRRLAVNLSRLERATKEGETIVVPGKLLGAGRLTHPVSVAAFAFSHTARKKVEAAGGRCLRLEELLEINPEGTGLRIMG